MANLPVVCVVKDAVKDDANLVWAAWGRGPNTFSRKLCALDPEATESTPPTHWLMSDTSTTDSDVAIMQGFADGDLPPVPSGTVWGENGVISAADALVAVNGTNLQTYSASGDVSPVEHSEGILESRGLQFVPGPEL